MGNYRLSGKQVGSQASRRVTRGLAWIQPVYISINAVPALKGLKPSSLIPSLINKLSTLGSTTINPHSFFCEDFNLVQLLCHYQTAINLVWV